MNMPNLASCHQAMRASRVAACFWSAGVGAGCTGPARRQPAAMPPIRRHSLRPTLQRLPRQTASETTVLCSRTHPLLPPFSAEPAAKITINVRDGNYSRAGAGVVRRWRERAREACRSAPPTLLRTTEGSIATAPQRQHAGFRIEKVAKERIASKSAPARSRMETTGCGG